MGHIHDAPGDLDVVVVVGRRLAIRFQAAVHHHAGEAILDRGGAGRLVVAVVLVHADRNGRVELDQRVNQSRQHDIVGVLPGASAGLDDHRRIGCLRGLHDRQPLLHIVDIECRHPVALLRGVIQKLPQRDPRHLGYPLSCLCVPFQDISLRRQVLLAKPARPAMSCLPSIPGRRRLPLKRT